MGNRTKQEIKNYMIDQTRKLILDDFTLLTAQATASHVSVSRNLASQYLNQLVEENELMKINSRPVYFLHIKTFEDVNHFRMKTAYFDCMEDFQDYVKNQKRDFESLIGRNGSLAYCIEQIKMAIQYPPNGLPILILGESGTGKTLLCEHIFRYMKSEQIIAESGRLNIIQCSKYRKHQKDFVEELLESPKSDLHENEQLVVFEDFTRLDEVVQNSILDFIRSNRNALGTPSNRRFILTTDLTGKSELLRHYTNRIPVILRSPSLNERRYEEREQLLISFFKKESRVMHKSIFVSQRVLEHLLNFSFSDNIEGLKREASKICAKAFLYQTDQAQLNIYSYYLSEEIVKTLKLDDHVDETKWISIDKYSSPKKKDLVQKYQSGFLDSFKQSQNEKQFFADLVEVQFQKLQECINDFSYESQYQRDYQLSSLAALLEEVARFVEERWDYLLPSNYLAFLAFTIKDQVQNLQMVESSDSDMNEMLELYLDKMAHEKNIVQYMIGLIETNLGFVLNAFNRVMVVLGVKYYNQRVVQEQVAGIVICHGYKTASSIADSVNQLLGKRVFEAIDMPLDVSIDEVVEVLKSHLRRRRLSNKMIIMVDMGSLEYIDDRLQSLREITLGIINNTSTSLALKIGSMIQNGYQIEEILERAVQNSTPKYKIIHNEKKEAAILFIGEKETNISSKMRDLFLKSLPKEVPLRTILHDIEYGQSDQDSSLQKEYDILFTIGVIDPKLKKVPHIDLTEMILMNTNLQIKEILKNYLSEEELETLIRNLLKNFSMQSIVEHLTILNPISLINDIEISLERIQTHLQQRLKPNTIMGLYIHLSSLIERLVTKNPIDHFGDIEAFQAQNQDFIDIVERSFTNITKHYNVSIPLSEIAYIYQFIEHNDDSEI